MATGDKYVNLDDLKAAYDTVIRHDDVQTGYSVYFRMDGTNWVQNGGGDE